VGAYTRGFAAYSGMQFPLPAGLPQRTITNPSGSMGYGVIARRDSIFVNF